MRWRSVGPTIGFALASLLSACDSGPQGPGVLPATVVAPEALGAVVLEFTGSGVLGFEGQGDTRVYSAAVPGSPDKHRVILVSPSGAKEMRFGIDLADRGGELPAVSAVSAASPSNAPLAGSGLRVRIER